MIEVRFQAAVPGMRFDVDFTTPGDGVTALFGRSGAGKSTIVEAIAGGLRPASGRLAVNGTVFFDTAAGIEIPVEQRRIGYVHQNSRLS